nr:hypothetical protein [Salmonella sp.]
MKACNIDDIEPMFNQVKIAKIKKDRKHVLRWYRRDALFEQYKSPVMQMDGRHWKQLANNGQMELKLAIVQADNPRITGSTVD